jgi:hypothetical protein
MGVQNVIQPIRAYAPNEMIKDSDSWEFLQYLQLNRINFLTTKIFTDRNNIDTELLNLISSIDHLEFLCIDKLNLNDNSNPEIKKKFLERKPAIFMDMDKRIHPDLIKLLNGDTTKKLQLKVLCTEWLKALNPALNSMKKIKRASFLMGAGVDTEPEEE